jgi:hypothetical protein
MAHIPPILTFIYTNPRIRIDNKIFGTKTLSVHPVVIFDDVNPSMAGNQPN